MLSHHIEIYPAGHPSGHPRLVWWCVRSPNDVAISGSSDDLDDALSIASSALQGVMKEAEASDERKD